MILGEDHAEERSLGAASNAGDWHCSESEGLGTCSCGVEEEFRIGQEWSSCLLAPEALKP